MDALPHLTLLLDVVRKTGMRTSATIGLIAGLWLVAPWAEAAQRTELIPFLHMDTEVGYNGGIQFGRLREQGTDETYYDVAKYNHHRHDLNVDIEFGICPMLELDVRFPIVLQDRLHYRSSNELGYDPDEDRATMLGQNPMPSEELEDFKRAGFGDMWIGLQFSPFNETYEKRPSPATLLLEFAVSPPTGRSRYDVNSRGVAAPGVGGPSLRVGAAFSKRVRGGEPYIAASYVMTGRYDVNLVNAEGQPTYLDGATLNPADSVHVLFGTELYAMNNPSSQTAINIDLFGGFSYYTWADIESGSIMPVIHPNTVGRLATTSEYLVPHFGLGLYIRPTSMVQIRLNTGLDYETSHIVERVDAHNYEIGTGVDTLTVTFGITVAGSFAPPKDKPAIDSSPIP